MNSFKKLSFLMIAAAIVLSPVAKAGDEPATDTQAMKAAPAVAANPANAAADASTAPADKTLLAKPAPTKKAMAAAQCNEKKCKTGKCTCTGKKHCKYCKNKSEHGGADGSRNDAEEKK
jgi:hypothetical protein